MTPEVGSIEAEATESHEIVAAVDESEGETRLVIANITRDHEWLSMAEPAAASLEEWR